MSAGSLVPYLDVLLVAVSYSWRYLYLRWIIFEMDASIIKSLLPGTYTPLPQAIFALTNGHKCIVQKHQWMCGGKLAVKLVKLSEYAGLLVCTAPRQVLEESSKVYTMCCL